MRSLAKLGIVAVGLALIGSVAACAIVGDDSDASSADYSFGHGPGNGRRPIGPIIADDDGGRDAGPTGPTLVAVDQDAAPPADNDGGTPTVTDDDASAPVDPPPADDDAGAP